MLKTAPEPADVQELQFKLRSRLKIFKSENAQFSQNCSLVASASRFGLIFVGTASSVIQVIKVKDIEEYNKNDGDRVDYPRRNLQLPSPATHLSVNCEHKILAVVIEKSGCPCVVFYDVVTFWQKDIRQIGEIRLSPTLGVHIVDVNWNPTLGSLFTACKSDGSLGIYEIKNPGININELPAAAGATCFCWSPKGKQIAVGSRDGKITQYKPDLKAVKVIDSPPLKVPCTLLSIQWVSNYQFIGVYQPNNTDDQTNFIVIDSPKTGECTYTNYDDICYSNGNLRPTQFYLIFLQNWNVMIAASSNSMEVGILSYRDDCWSQWIMGDAARAELPLDSNHQETLPVGCAVDFGSTQPLLWGESTLPPAPVLLLLSDHGMLCCFNIINLKEGIPSLCTPSDPITDTSGLQQFVTADIGSKVDTNVAPKEDSPQTIQLVPNTQHAQTPKTSPVISKSQPSIFGIQQDLNFSQNQPRNLFSSQVTSTPVSHNQNIQGAAFSQNQSLLPVVNEKKVVSSPSVNSSTSLLSPSVISSQIISKPLVSSVQTIATISASKPSLTEELGKSEIVDMKAEEEAEKIFGQMVKEECIFLESEVKATLHQGKNLKLDLGTDDDKTTIVENTTLLEKFSKEVLEICATQNAEIHILKQNLLQSWAWYEEVKSRHLASEDMSLMMLIRLQPLNPVLEKQLADIQHSNYYLESQIIQAHQVLDEQWENFQDYFKKSCKIQIPTMEMIFQTMVKQNAILRKQSYILKDIASRIKNKSRSSVGPSLLISVNDTKDLPEELKKLRLHPEDICRIQYKCVMNRTKNFTKKKVDTLRSFLKKREYLHTAALKPQLSTSVIQVSPTSKLKQISLKVPPILKKLPSKKLDFLQSVPKMSAETTVVTSTENEPNTATEGLQNFTHKVESRNFTNLSDKTFTPLTKGIMSGSPNSAFVSTSVGSNNLFKSFSFSGAQAIASHENVPNASKPNNNLFTAVTSKPPFSFNLQNVPSTTTTSSFGVIDAKNVTSSKATAIDFTVTSTTKPATTTYISFTTSTCKTTATTGVTPTKIPSGFAFGTTSTAPFSFSDSTSDTTNIFGSVSQKSVDSSVAKAATKPFTFFSKTTSVTTTPTLTVSATSKTSISQPLNFSVSSVATVDTTKSLSNSPLVTSLSSPIINISKLENKSISSPSVFGFTQTTTTGTSAAAIGPQTFVSNSTETTHSPGLPVGGAKSSIFFSAPLTKTTSNSVVTTSTVSLTTASSTNVLAVTTVTNTSIFNDQTTTSKSNIFGPTVSSTQATVLPLTTSAANFTFGSSITTSASSIFGSAGTNGSKPLLFSSSSPNTTTTNSFGASTAAMTQSSVFGNTASTSVSSLFRASVPTTTQTFGSSPNQMSLFGSTVPTTSQTIFGSSTTPTSQSTAFGSFGDATQKKSIFGSTAANSTTSSVFGSVNPPIFGNSPSGTTSIFGQSQTPSTFGQSSAFGFGTTSPFGSSAPTFGQSSGSIFRNAPTTSGNIFGGTSTTGGTFGSSSAFGSPPSSPSSPFGSNIAFSTNTSQSSSFAGNTNAGLLRFRSLNMGSTPTTSAFGTAPNPFENKSIFGSSNPSSNSSVFGSTTNSVFGSTSQNFTGSFGSQTVFGQQSTFGQSTFGSGSFGQQSSGGPFSSGSSGSVSQTGFGGSPTFQKLAGFGNPPVFGGSPSFGSPPTFAGSPAFGSSTFGSSPKIFGSNNATFGSGTSTQNTGFGNLANQPTVGFGNLAQQAANVPTPSTPFSGNSSFSSWR